MTSLAEAVQAALWDEMEAHENTLLLGEALTSRGGASKITYGFEDAFGSRRVVETPISENALVGGAFGAALGGARVICEVYSADFIFCAGSEIFNDLAKWRYEHQYDRPLHLILRMPTGSAGMNAGPEHTQAVEAYLHHAPGLRVVVPSDAQAAYDGLRGGLACGDPVFLLEHRALYREELGDLSRQMPATTNWRRGQVCQDGDDLTIVAWGRMRTVAMAAAARLRDNGISAEVVDPVSVKPLDMDLIVSSIRHTGRLLVVEESPRTGSVAAEIVTSTLESVPDRHVELRRLTMEDVHPPFHSSLEADVLPGVDDVVVAATQLVGVRIGG